MRKKSAFQTLSRHEVPQEFREEYVEVGFRPVDKPFSYYLCTIFTKHNETVNVWTHLVPFLIVLRRFAQILRENKGEPSIEDSENNINRGATADGYLKSFYLFMLTVLAYLLVSAGAHLLHSVSRLAHYLAFYCDFVTIAFYSFLSATTFYTYSSTEEFFRCYKNSFIPIACLLSLAVSLGCCYAKFKFTRPYPFAKKAYICGTIGTLYLWNIYPVVNRMWFQDLQGNTCHTMHIVFFLLAVFFYSSGFPQKAFPGKCDFWLHGHQIFHVLIAITTWFQIKAVKLDMETYSLETRQKEDWNHCWNQVFTGSAILAVVSFLGVRYFFKKIENVIKKKCK